MNIINMEEHDGSHEEFIRFIFSKPPKDEKSISLELPLETDRNIGLHIFEQLLMIFTDGSRYLYGENGKVNVNKLNVNSIDNLNKYFESFGFTIIVEIFETIHDYKFKFPNYFKNQKNIKPETKLEDYYYEIFNENNCAYRVSFKKL